tara:strand:+ start:434 stop:754 length:321 start_codon:yes stop_codon:yes gene_type:complete
MLNADLENFTIDQFAGALALSLGAIGSLLLVIWQSKCHCRINLCWLFTCERKPGPDEAKDKKDKKDKKGKQGKGSEANSDANSDGEALTITDSSSESTSIQSPPNP